MSEVTEDSPCDLHDLEEQLGADKAEMLYEFSPRWRVRDMHLVNEILAQIEDQVMLWVRLGAGEMLSEHMHDQCMYDIRDRINTLSKVFEKMRAREKGK